MTSGLHTCKPGNEPEVGQTKTFTIEQRTGKSGKPWTKIKSAPEMDGGTPYKIMKVAKTDYADQHGNLSFNLEIEPSNGAPTAQVATQRVKNGGWSEERSARIERQHSQDMAIQYLTMRGISNLAPEAIGKMLVEMIDWFQRDISRSPERKSEPQPEPEPQAQEPDDDDEF